MSPRLAQYGLLWRSALALSHPRAHLGFLWLAPLLSLAAAVLGYLGGDLATAWRWGWNILCSVTMLTWAWAYLPGAFRLNTPANAQLTPGMRARLRELGMAVWLFCVVGIVLGNPGNASGLALPAAWFMIVSLGMALAASGSTVGTVVMIVSWPLMGLPSFIPGWMRTAMAHPAFLPLLAALLVVPALATMRAIFPQAGDRHWRLLDKRNGLRSKDVFGNREGSPSLLWLQTRSLRRACARRNLGAMLLHGCGPGLQQGGIALGIGALGLLGLGVMVLVHLSGHPKAAQVAADTGWIWSLLPLLVFQLHTLLLANLTEMPAGQPLLRLAPAMPATAPRFNRQLATTVLRSSLAAWAIAAATAIAGSVLSGARSAEILVVACLCCLALPALILPLRDHARRPRWNPVLQWLLVLILSGACLLVALAAQRVLALPVLPTAALIAIALTVLVAARRYSAMVGAPFAFPAGRLD